MAMVALQSQLKRASRIQNFMLNTKTKVAAPKQTGEYFQARVGLLEKYWDSFESNHFDLLEVESELADQPYFKDDMYTQVEITYIEAIAELKTDVKRLTPATGSEQPFRAGNHDDQAPILRLPALSLPTFSGKQEDWESFKQRFEAVLATQPRLPNVAKLQHLMNAVQGPAALRLKGMAITDDNYAIAWDRLMRRYDNPHLRLAGHVENLIQLPAMRSRNVADLTTLVDRAEESVRALVSLEWPTARSNPFIMHAVIRKLDISSKEAWNLAREQDQENHSTYEHLVAFLEGRLQSLEQAQSTSSENRSKEQIKSKTDSSGKASNKSVSANLARDEKPSCACCPASHRIYACDAFRALAHKEKFSVCKREKLCLNCLGKGHMASSCPSPRRCSNCQGKHHSLLHVDNQSSSPNSKEPGESSVERKSTNPEEGSPPSKSSTVVAHAASIGGRILLATANIVIGNRFGTTAVIRALIDPAAERSFITERIASTLLLPGRRVAVTIVGVGSSAGAKTSREVVGIVRSSSDPSFERSSEFLVLPALTQMLPSQKVPLADWPHIRGLDLADPRFANPGHPISPNGSLVSAFHVQVDHGLDRMLTKFWELEEIPYKPQLSESDQYCEEFYQKTTFRDPSGRYCVRLPFAKPVSLSDTKEIALSCLLRSEKRRLKNPALNTAYVKFMEDYIAQSHMRLTPSRELTTARSYLPHHAVFRSDGSGKIRVVFNASQRSSSGVSLNELLLTGPKLQPDITAILSRWRFYRFAFTTDIVQMFRQILVHPDDLKWQHILWRSDTSSRILDYQATTVTYGTAPAPFLAIRTLNQLASDGQSTYPEAALILRKQTYVDDIFSGANSLDLALERRNQLINLLLSAQMRLSKWAANSDSLLQEESPTDSVKVPLDSENSVSTLGLKWDVRADAFFFTLQSLDVNPTLTKRGVLSEISRLFDPLGFLAPVIIVPKIIMQDIWLEKTDWDEPLPGSIKDRWLSFRQLLPALKEIRIPRRVASTSAQEWQLHGFSDASQRAYAAVIYVVPPPSHQGEPRMILAKSKVAPVKTQSLPRLELCGALLLTRLVKSLLNNLDVPPASVNLWSDSRVVLDWLRGHPSRWPVFIANRVSEIVSDLPKAVWRHVPTQDNPADCASRGLNPNELESFSLWWSGPPWLMRNSSEWPCGPAESPDESETTAHLSTEINLSADHESEAPKSLIDRFREKSSYTKSIRILAYLFRWRSSGKPPPCKLAATTWSAANFSSARTALFRLIQGAHFSSELRLLREGRDLPFKSPLSRLLPFIDEKGLLRVGGRLQNSPLSYDEKHAIILPGKEVLVRRLVEHAHNVTFHGGVRVMLSYLSRSYWILQGTRLTQGVYRRCTTCARYSGRAAHQQMAPLPSFRLQAPRTFAFTGVDYAGPFPLLFSKGRGAKSVKGYVAVFVCMVVKAVHIEVVSDLTVDAFLAAFQRFISRKGVPTRLYSDNGTTFTGAAAELQRRFRDSSPEMRETANRLAQQGIEWECIPPRAPHFGGLWEAAVKSFKAHLYRVIGAQKLTFEELSTVTAGIESCLNSPPICPLSSVGSDEVALTPAHFIIGTPLLTFPEPYSEENLSHNLYHPWRMLSQMRNSFWARWRREALTLLQKRNKWLKKADNIKVDDIVLIKDEITPPGKWPLGRVLSVHPGSDGLVRVANVKTASSEFKRPIAKLIKLHTDDEVVDLSQCIDSESSLPSRWAAPRRH